MPRPQPAMVAAPIATAQSPAEPAAVVTRSGWATSGLATASRSTGAASRGSWDCCASSRSAGGTAACRAADSAEQRCRHRRQTHLSEQHSFHRRIHLVRGRRRHPCLRPIPVSIRRVESAESFRNAARSSVRIPSDRLTAGSRQFLSPQGLCQPADGSSVESPPSIHWRASSRPAGYIPA